VCLLDADEELGNCISKGERATARRAAVTSAIWVPAGPWIGERRPPGRGHLGYLVLGGLVSRELRVAGGRSVELLGAGDIMRPWQEDSASFCDSRYRAVVATRLAALDEGLAERISAWPRLTAELLERAVRRSRTLAAVAAIGHVVGVEQRLVALFWCLAERWGTVSREGVTIPLPLTHQALADMVGAQRPSVTSALGKLARAGTLTRRDGTWTLHGNAP
jgi:CRP-like cAMP-binding protein